jgi:hypothetical protein
MSEYTEKAEKFLKDTETKMSVRFVRYAVYFTDDKDARDIFRITFTRQGVRRSFLFGQSTNDSTGNGDNPPSAYDVLACLEKYGYESFEDFCSSLGYDEDSRKALKTYKGVIREAEKVNDLWNDCLAQLQEIQ